MFKCEDLNLNEFLALPERYGDFVSDTVFYTVRAFSLHLTTLTPFVNYAPSRASRSLECLSPNSIMKVLSPLRQRRLDEALLDYLGRMSDVYTIGIWYIETC